MTGEDRDDIKRHFSVVAEALRSEIRLLAEGQGATNDRLDHFEAFVASEFKAARGEIAETKALIRLSFGQLDHRITTLENDVQSLRERLDRLEGRSHA